MPDDLQGMISPELYEHIDLCAEQIWYWRTHLDCFIVDYLNIKLYDTQRVIAREIGNSWDVSVAMNRGYGKTWLLAVCAVALAILWPDTPIAVVSNTAIQANLLLQKIDREILPNEDIQREIDYGVGRGIRIKDNGNSVIFFKNGSRIMSFVLGHKGTSALGQRAKILIIDEAKLIDDAIVNKVLKPITSYKRPIYHRIPGFADYKSKVINISSAFFKSCDYYGRFKNTLKRMARGEEGSFACAVNFESCIRIGLQDAEFYEREQESMSPVEFAMEYGSVFVGAADDSVFPYSLTEPCRTLTSIELSQPKDSTCRYVISVDLAGPNDSATADNSCISVLKMIEKTSGRWQKHLVWMRTYRGWTQRQLAEEIRRIYLRFPNTVRITFDRNGLGVGMTDLLDQPWTYEDERGNRREMLPLVPHDASVNYPANKILYPFVATNALNEEMAQVMLRNLNDMDLRLPAVSTTMQIDSAYSRIQDDADDEKTKKEKKRRTVLLTEEALVFKEADSLQAEMGNIVCRRGAKGNSLYDTALSTQKKDRYSSLAMGMWHIDQIENYERRMGYVASDASIPVFIGNFY